MCDELITSFGGQLMRRNNCIRNSQFGSWACRDFPIAYTYASYLDHARGRRSWLAAAVADRVVLLAASIASGLGALCTELNATRPCGCSTLPPAADPRLLLVVVPAAP